MTYSNSLALGRRRSFAGHNQNAVSFKVERKKLGPVSNTVILIVLACLVGLLYLTQVTRTNGLGYQINNLDQQQSALQTKHSDLEVTAARLQATSKVKASKVAKSMTSVTPSATVKS
jgi:hypothetical protein